MTTQAQTSDRTWSASSAHVRKAIAFIRKAGKDGRTPDEMVAWDLANGRRLFDWDDAEAARLHRLQQARNFINSFRAVFERKRVRAFIHVREDGDLEIGRSAYVSVEDIADHPGMREQVVSDITRRMKSLASELAMWKLSDSEQADLFAQLRESMSGRQAKAA